VLDAALQLALVRVLHDATHLGRLRRTHGHSMMIVRRLGDSAKSVTTSLILLYFTACPAHGGVGTNPVRRQQAPDNAQGARQHQTVRQQGAA
jgi:hypothetical protein